jgi:hypothetical protein
MPFVVTKEMVLKVTVMGTTVVHATSDGTPSMGRLPRKIIGIPVNFSGVS